MCHGWEPDDIVQIIIDIKRHNKKLLETIDKALEKTALELGKKYRGKDYPNITLTNFISRFYDKDNKNLTLLQNELTEINRETGKPVHAGNENVLHAEVFNLRVYPIFCVNGEIS
jgi:hypothetical protein